MKPRLLADLSFPGRLFLAGVPFMLTSSLASAAAYTWDGGGADSNWQTSGNWNPDGAPSAGITSDLIFAGTTRLTPSNDFTALSDFGSLTFASGAGAFTLSGNSITLNGNITNSSSNLQTISYATTLAAGAHTLTTSSSVTISGVVSGDGSLNKNGANTLSFSNANTYTGATTVNAGTLALSGVGGTLASSAVTVNSTAIFSVTNANATGSAVTRTNGLTLNGGKLTVTGSSTHNTTDSFGVLTLGQGAGVPSGGTQSASVLSGGNNVILVSPNSAKNTRLNFTNATVNAGGTVLFSNNGGSVIGTNTLASATANGINVAFTTTAPTLIGDAVTGGTITTTSGIIPWAVTNASGGTTLSDFLTYDSAYGVRSLAASAGTYASNLALSGGKAQNVKITGSADTTNNTNTTVNSLILNNQSSSITQNIIGTLTVNSGALLLAPGFNVSAFSTTIAGGTLKLGTDGADGYIFMQQGRLNTISSAISGPDASHHVVLDFGNANESAGVLVLSGNNSYLGGTIVNSSNAGSSLVIGGTSTLSATPTLTAGTTGSFGSGDVTLNNIKVLLNRSDAVTVANNFNGAGGVIQQSATSTATLSGNISGSVGVTVNKAAGTLVLSGTNTNTGPTTLSSGTLQLNGSASMSGNSDLTIASGTTLNLRGDTTASFTPASISASGIGTYNIDIGNLTSGTGQTLTLAGAMDFANGSQSLNITSGSTGYALGLGAITHSTTANGSSFTINAATAPTAISSFKFGSYGSNLTLQSGNISVGGLIFNSNGSETITVAGANATFTGSNTATSSRAAGAYAVILNSGTLNMNYGGFMNNVNSGGSSLTLAGGTLDNTSGGSVTESWNPTVALNGDFTFGGTNALNLGTGQVSLSGSREITTNGTAALTLGGSISGSGHSITKSGSGNLTLGGVIGTGSGGVTVNGGTLTLAGNNTYTGATTVSAGKLVVTGSIANSAVTVSNTGTILASDAAATIGSSLVINDGAILAPGDAGAAGTATVSGATSFDNGSIFSWDISSNGAGYDKLQTASLAGEITPGDAVFRIVVADSGFSDSFWNSGTKTWNNIFTTNGTTAISNWASLFSLSVVNSSFNSITPVNGSFSISGSTLTWSAVPEPTSAFAGLLIGAGLLRRRRKN